MILKNTTQADITITGRIIPAEGQIAVNVGNFLAFRDSDELVSYIGSGDVVVNNGVQDLSPANGIRHLNGAFPSNVTPAPFSDKKLIDGKKVFRRKHGVKQTVAASSTENIDFTIPYPHAKITGATIINGKTGDTVDFVVLDDASGTYSGFANAQLNQFGFDVVVYEGFFKDECPYDADLYQNMVLRVVYTNTDTSAKEIGLNVTLHEVKE